MDRIRRLYRSQMRLYVGGPLVWGRWEWCPPDAELFGPVHVFGSSSWDPRDRWTSTYPIGEQRDSVEWTRPTEMDPRLRGETFCGGERVLLGGATAADVGTPEVDAGGVPPCCDPPPFVGGTEDGGLASWHVVPVPVGLGVLTLPWIMANPNLATLSRQQLTDNLTCWLDQFEPGFVVHLFVNNVKPTLDSEFADFALASFGGYSAAPLPDWGAIQQEDKYVWTETEDEVAWTAEPGVWDSQTVYGWFVTTDDMVFRFGRRFVEPILIEVAGQGVVFRPAVAFANATDLEL